MFYRTFAKASLTKSIGHTWFGLDGKLEPFTDYLLQRIREAHPAWLPAPVLMREIEERGYTGSLSLLKQFYLPLRPARQQDHEPVVRFETAPGMQMQADFVVFRRGKSPLAPPIARLSVGWRK